MIQIVLVEDEEMILKGLRYTIDWLSMNASIVAVAENGLEGLSKIKEYTPDLVITDIKMPVMDGLSMIAQAKEQGLSFLPVILTSYSDFEYAKESIRLQVFDFLLKPIDEEKLKDLLIRANQFLEQERSREKERSILKSIPEQTEVFFLSKNIENPHVKFTLSRIENSYTAFLSIQGIAEELKISTSYLSRVFKQECGCTFLDFLNRYRVRKSIDLLCTGKYRLYEIAPLCGFSDYKRFYQVFREYTDRKSVV